MIFQSPIMLYGLPAVTLPIVIHLLNRLRYRSVRWAAMIFLISATRSSTRNARIRHYLILLFRTLAILLLILALARPKVGGWLGQLTGGAPETVVVVLDRSASMEATDPRMQVSKRLHAIRLFAAAAEETGTPGRFVLIENVLRKPQEIATPAVLERLPLSAATDTAADIPSMLRSTLDYLVRNPSGRTEIWLASDMQRTNWRPKSREWKRLSSQLAAVSDNLKVRLITLTAPSRRNASIRLAHVMRRHTSDTPTLGLAMDIRRVTSEENTIPLTLTVGNARTQTQLKIDGQHLRYNKLLDLTSDDQGWGSATLPADENQRDNTCYFVHGSEPHLRAVVVAETSVTAHFLQLAVAPAPHLEHRSCERVALTRAAELTLNDLAMVLWAAPLPSDELATRLVSFVQKGGTVIFFPPAQTAGARDDLHKILDLRWGRIDTATTKEPFTVPLWEERDGLLAATYSGEALPVGKLTFTRRQVPTIKTGTDNDASVWFPIAHFGDGRPFLMRRTLGRGRAYVCTSLPQSDWSSLQEGSVLVPFIQRALTAGGRRMALADVAECGQWEPQGSAQWKCAEPEGKDKDYRWHAGVYHAEGRWIALNRPESEDDPTIVPREHISELFGDVEVDILDDLSERQADAPDSDVWHLFLLAALACLVTESGLVLAEKQARKR